MKSFKQFIHEARRNPEQNPKINATDYLRKYKDRDDIYISFTQLPKIGINPKTKYDTPAGVYTYPLKEFWKHYNVDTKGSVSKAAPFAGRSPYIQILRGKHTKGFIQDISNYSHADLIKDQQKILSYINDEYYRKRVKEEIIDNADSEAFVKTPFGKFWYITYEISNYEIMKNLVGVKSRTSSFAWTELFRKMGYTGFADKKGQGIIYVSEPVQTVFLDPREYTQIDMIENKEHKNNLWNGGVYKDTEFNNGVWMDGIFEGRRMDNVDWKKGTFKGSTFSRGTWRDGDFCGFGICNSKWMNGTFHKGEFCSTVWSDGTFKGGEFISGQWQKGTWENGIWDGGTWYGGCWKKGCWADGSIYSCKFNQLVCSEVNPQEFCKHEANSKTLQDLLNEVESGMI